MEGSSEEEEERDGGRQRIIRIEREMVRTVREKCSGMRMDRLKGGGRLNRRVVFDRGVTA